MIKKIISFLIILGILLPSFSFAQQPTTPPETLEEVKEMGEKTLKETMERLPGILEKIWKEEVLPIWQKMWDWFKKNIWDPYIVPFFKKEVEPRAKEEIEKRKPIIEEEFKKEKKELKEELPKVGKSLWEKFKELIK